MKSFKSLIKIYILFFIIFTCVFRLFSDTWVNGYYRKNGTYVKGHWRKSYYNNFSWGDITQTKKKTKVKSHYREGTWVNGYYRKDGTYVRGYYRSGGWVNSYVKEGDYGESVIELQKLLNKHGYHCDIDGIFGNETLYKVKQFQYYNSLKDDGIVGYRTWKVLKGGLFNSESLFNNFKTETIFDTYNIKVIDGDTFYYKGKKYRVQGIDTPEKGQYNYEAAKIRLTELLKSGIVTVEEVAIDVYGRTVAEVYVNYENVAQILKNEGYQK